MLEERYEKVLSVEDGVRRLLTIRDREIPTFSLCEKRAGEYVQMLNLDGRDIPMLSWRYEPRMKAISDYGKRAGENCALNTSSFAGVDMPLSELIYKELDIAEYALSSKIVKVTAFIRGAACNLIAKCESGAQANLELGTTMAARTIPQFQHRLITTHGMANDKGVNDLVEQSGVYIFKNSDTRPIVYNDGEYYLYGLTVEQSVDVTFIQGVITGALSADALIEQDKHLKDVLAAVYKSAEICESVIVGGAE